MQRDLLFSGSASDRRMIAMDGAILRSLDRFMGQLVQSTWQDLLGTLGMPGEPMDYSGLHPLGASQLEPYLDRPGVFLLFGPLPEVCILHLGSSQAAIRDNLTSKLVPEGEGGRKWGWVPNTTPTPAFATCGSMVESLTLIPAMKTLLAQRLAPLQSAFPGPGEETPFV